MTEHQKEIYECYIQEDLSLAEIAEEFGTSRQAVHDVIKRCNALLSGYEEKLHLVERFLEIKELAEEIKGCGELKTAKRAADSIIEKL